MVKKTILIIFFCCYSAIAYSSGLNEKMSNRALTLSPGLWEIDFVSYFTRPTSENYSFGINLVPRYGLTDNIELSIFGVKYNFKELSPKFQLALRFEIPTIGYSDSANFIYDLEGGVTTKYQINFNSAVLFDVSEVFSHGVSNEFESSANVSYVYSYSSTLSFSSLLGVHRPSFLNSTFKVAYFTIYYSYTPKLDFYSSVGYSAIGSLLSTKYHLVDEKKVFGFGLQWRF